MTKKRILPLLPKVALLVAALGSSPVVSAADRAPKRPVSVAAAVTMATIATEDDASGDPSFAHFSPDGRWLAFIVNKPDLDQNVNTASLMLYDTTRVFQASSPRILAQMSSSVESEPISQLRWLADGQHLVFLGTKGDAAAQVYLVDISDGRLLQRTQSSTSVLTYDITPDGDQIAFSSRPQADPLPPAVAGHSACREVVVEGQNLYELLTGKNSSAPGDRVYLQPRDALPIAVPVASSYIVRESYLSLSPNGRYLVFSGHLRDFRDRPEWANYHWPGLKEFFQHHLPEPTPSPWQQYLLFDRVSGKSSPLIDAPILTKHATFWKSSGSELFLKTYLPLNDPVDAGERVEREQHSFSIVVHLPGRTYERSPFPVHKTQSPLRVDLEQSLNQPPALSISDPATKQRAVVFDPNPQFRDLEFGLVRELEWKVDGIRMNGGLYLPPHFDPQHRYPLVIQTHGFDSTAFSMDGRSEWSSGFAARALAARGFLVLQTDEFSNREDHDRVSDDREFGATPAESFRNFSVLSIEKAIDTLDRQRLVDRGRIGVIGFSRTACFVAYALTHSKYNFAAALLVDGISCSYVEEIALPAEAWDLNSINGGAAPYGHGLDVWIRKAPGFNLDKVRSPLRLVALGRGSVLSAWEFYVGLKMQGKPVELAILPGGTHIGVTPRERAWSQQGIVDWFEYWLKVKRESAGNRDRYARWDKLRR